MFYISGHDRPLTLPKGALCGVHENRAHYDRFGKSAVLAVPLFPRIHPTKYDYEMGKEYGWIC